MGRQAGKAKAGTRHAVLAFDKPTLAQWSGADTLTKFSQIQARSREREKAQMTQTQPETPNRVGFDC